MILGKIAINLRTNIPNREGDFVKHLNRQANIEDVSFTKMKNAVGDLCQSR